MHGGEPFREKPARHDFAENIPHICHSAVKVGRPWIAIHLNFWHRLSP
jgi:hypothetical protein